MDKLDSLRQHLIDLLTKAEAHVDLCSAIEDFPAQLAGRKPEGAPHTPWQLLEHIRIAQWDILRFMVDPKHVSPKFPEGYWPATEAPPAKDAWQKSVKQILSELDALCDLLRDPKQDLFRPLPHGTGQTLLREALLVADHNAYHLGQLVTVRRILEGE
jgi:DinB superfamily